MLKFEHVYFHYRRERPVLKDISFSVQSGEFLSIVGGNGSGKSTLARLMNGLLLPRLGKVRLEERDTSNPDDIAPIRRQVGLVFQNPDDQFITTSVTDEIIFGLENIRVPREQIGDRIGEALQAVSMTEYAHAAPHELSGGQKQRAAIAAILAMRPRLMIFDEATSMLDPQGRAQIMNLMTELHRKGMTIVHITHHMDEVLAAGRVLLLDRGQLIFDGAPNEMFSTVSLEAYTLEKPFAVRLHERLQLSGTVTGDWKEAVRTQWPSN
ncbi:energy-coupling factor transporter ATPase [Saccharibacillus kuerlensis]|uniref:Energy-coupling factor transporter ATP-binding protein EcfA1 n=1 Tax=Saccharibacillus kuerlensis TaxID=459527 RepID=A0ABQ2L409_9BACL|nr:energy-coupling factor transporter ATPase [Saccharibacillus kuerlensis]GGO01961.1 energy-coupling factor transporter ATP-binding protein EcfA1 [Saccharibacillus kuerlensis]